MRMLFSDRQKQKNKNRKRRGLGLLAGALAVELILGQPAALGQSAITVHAAKADLTEETIRSEETLRELASQRDIMAVVYLCNTYSLKKKADEKSETVASLACGRTVFVQDSALDHEGSLWLKVSTEAAGNGDFGWIERKHLACSDERFLHWEEQTGYAVLKEGEESGTPADVAAFPAGYQQGLMELKAQHPNWIFVPMETGLDWNTAITNELAGGRSLVHKSLPDWDKEGAYDQGNWFYASREILERYMDPRNSLTENTIFQFEQLTYNESYHTLEAMESFLEGTFMNSSVFVPGTEMKYSFVIYMIGKEEGREVSPFHLAARILQEQGQGRSPLISGTYSGYEGYYNYFNVGATGTTNAQVIQNGLKYARNQGWDSAYKAILGGANYISSGYIKKGQDTLYLQKFNVNPASTSGLYNHQYMQNISAPTTEASSIKKLYADANALNSPFVFKIPVYQNMPEAACPNPTMSTNVVIEIPQGYTDNKVWIDGTCYTAEKRNKRLIVPLGYTGARTAVIYSGQNTWYYRLTFAENRYKATETEALPDPTAILLPLPAGVEASIVWLDGIAYPATRSGDSLLVNASNFETQTAVIYTQQANGLPGNMYVYTLEYSGTGYQATLQTGLTDLLCYSGFSMRVKGDTGIRFKTAIPVSARDRLLDGGIDGFHLKEYGTLIMEDSDRTLYPMILGGARVTSGVSFRIENDGSVQDILYEKKNDKYCFTSVLIGLNVKDYKTVYAFRGYAKLEISGREIMIYGPVMAKSMYTLAKQIQAAGYYEEGCEPELFIRNVILQAELFENP